MFRQQKKGNDSLHYGWIVVGVTFIAILVASGIRSVTGVLMLPLEEEFKWSRSIISFAFAVNLTLYGFSGPFFAAGMEKFGVRKMMVSAMAVLVSGMLLSLVMNEIWHLMVIWGIIIGLGAGVFLTVLSATVANRWFAKKRGMVLGVLMAATAGGQMIFLPLLSYVTGLYSWRISLAIFVVLGIVMIPIIFYMMRDYPSDKGISPYGADPTEVKVSRTSKKNPIATAFEGLWMGIRSVPFWLLATSFFICGASTAGLIGTHFIPASSHHGIPEVHAASIFAFMGVLNIIGTIFSGWLSDRFDNRWLLFWYYALRGIALLILPYALESQSYLMLTGFAIFYGLDWIATVPPTVRIASDHFGNEWGAVIYGWLFAAHQLGSGAAAYLGGFMFELNHSYTLTFITAGVLCILATLFVLGIKKTQKIEVATQPNV
ncbi:MFS transporter [Bacillus sp. M6-12]|uniref:MFS transporter n=1 Tax=Bacillus sp. M6-12 TaxID=2054166 RepID=UPI000C786458|nr:MFS transporter [Bacillus sp. M6-12]PLS18538.1 MFS transporter [Bacillus sp. M6-12]